MKSPLTPKEASEAKASFSLVITALFLQEIARGIEPEGTVDNPAVSMCTEMVDDFLKRHDEERRNLMIARINGARVRLTKRVKSLDLGNALVGSLRVLSGDQFISKPGTKFDFIRQNFRSNLSDIEKSMELDQKEVAEFQRAMRNAFDRI